MQLINKFHKMEVENKLFDLGKESGLPIWDIIRYRVYIKYYYSAESRMRLEAPIKHSFNDYLALVVKLIDFLFKILFYKADNLCFTASRYRDANGNYFDKSASAIIDTLGERSLIIEPVLNKPIEKSYLYDFSIVFRRFKKGTIISQDDFKIIEESLVNYLGENRISYEEINQSLLNFKSDYAFYKRLFRKLSTKKIFISIGNPKAQVAAARELKLKTYLLQHASIEFDEVDYSYPHNISVESNILFPDYVLTFGDYWGKGLNIPAESIIPIGNDFFFSNEKAPYDGSILVISTIVHGGELKILTQNFANTRLDLNFIYKLHPNEFHYYNEYLEFFKENANVEVITNALDTNALIGRSQLVVLIVSAILYEALNQNKKIAIYKRINFERQLHLLSIPNVYLIDNVAEAIGVLGKEVILSEFDFYKPTDYKLINELLSS